MPITARVIYHTFSIVSNFIVSEPVFSTSIVLLNVFPYPKMKSSQNISTQHERLKKLITKADVKICQ